LVGQDFSLSQNAPEFTTQYEIVQGKRSTDETLLQFLEHLETAGEASDFASAAVEAELGRAACALILAIAAGVERVARGIPEGGSHAQALSSTRRIVTIPREFLVADVAAARLKAANGSSSASTRCQDELARGRLIALAFHYKNAAVCQEDEEEKEEEIAIAEPHSGDFSYPFGWLKTKGGVRPGPRRFRRVNRTKIGGRVGF